MYDHVAGDVVLYSADSAPNKSTSKQADELGMVRDRLHSPHVLHSETLKSLLLIFSRAVAWILLVVIVILSLVPHQLRPETGLPNNFEHAGIFAAAGRGIRARL